MTVLVGKAGAEEVAIGVVLLAPGPERPDFPLRERAQVRAQADAPTFSRHDQCP